MSADTDYYARELDRVIGLGPADDESWFRLKLSGAQSTKYLSVTPDQARAIRDILAGESTPNLYDSRAWADDDGVWHVSVRKGSTELPIEVARQRLRYELEARSGTNLDPRVWRNPVRVPGLDREDRYVYRELVLP